MRPNPALRSCASRWSINFGMRAAPHPIDRPIQATLTTTAPSPAPPTRRPYPKIPTPTAILAVVSLPIRSESAPRPGCVRPCTRKYAENSAPAVASGYPWYATRKAWRNDAVACQTNIPTAESITVRAMGGRRRSSRRGPARKRLQMDWFGRTGGRGRTTATTRANAGSEKAVPRARAHRHPIVAPTAPAATGTNTPATGAPAVWMPMAVPIRSMLRVRSDVATL
jgi:hypothetical protein